LAMRWLLRCAILSLTVFSISCWNWSVVVSMFASVVAGASVALQVVFEPS
jgi:hypothetical protein